MRKKERKEQGGQVRGKLQTTLDAHVKTAAKFKLAHRVVDSGNHYLTATRCPPPPRTPLSPGRKPMCGRREFS